MSGSALFSNNITRGISKNLIEIKAGKMSMKGKMVYPDKRRGQLYVYQSDDSLMHFCWKDRSTGVVEDDLIVFPDDCEFRHVSQCKTGRVYLLKFKSSSRRFFFWLQDFSTDKDDEYCKKMNEILNNPPAHNSQRSNSINPEGDIQNLLNNMSQQQLMQLFGGVGQIGGLGNLLGSINRPFSANRGSTSPLNPVTATTTAPSFSPPASSGKTENTDNKIDQSGKLKESPIKDIPSENCILLSDLQSFLCKMPTSDRDFERDLARELSITVSAAISLDDNIENLMNKYLPIGDSLSTTLSSPQFSQSLSMFWSAIQSGQVAPVIQQFGLSSKIVEAAASGNVQNFINAFETEIGICPSSEQNVHPEKDTRLNEEYQKENLNELQQNDDDNDDNDEGMSLD